jgi:O-antigen ligase
MGRAGAGSDRGPREPGGGAFETSGCLTLSNPRLVRLAGQVRILGRGLELVLWFTLAGSALAFGSVHPWAYESLWLLCGLAGLVALARARSVVRARRELGARPIGLPSAGRWLVVDPPPDDTTPGWRCDLGAPLVGGMPLLWPGLAFLGLSVFQLLPWPPEGVPLTLSPEATRRGAMFVAALLVLHVAAAGAFTDDRARRRIRRLVSGLGLVLGLVALVQLASGMDRIYGVFQPWESPLFYGPFVNRNHFAGYMLLVIPVGLSILAESWRRYRRRVGGRPSVRRHLIGLGSEAGTRVLYAALPPLVAIATLLASTSRGGLLAFAAGLALAAIGLRSRRGTPAWAAALVFVAVSLFWFGLERLEVRFLQTPDDAPGRTTVWRESIESMEGPRWLSGFGFNTFAEAFSRVPAWRLPVGATPWPEGVREALESGAPYGYRTPGDLPGLPWYREAHNDWLQLLVETGLPGLALGVWGALGVLLAARRDPWLFAGLAAPLMHAFVDFDFQIPAIAVLFVMLAALAGASGPIRMRGR